MSHLSRRAFLATSALSAGAALTFPRAAVSAVVEQQLNGLQAGFAGRRDAGIGAIDLENFQPHAIDPPLGPGRPPFTRTYGYSVAAFALAAFWRNQHVAEANEQLKKLCEYFIANRTIRNDQDNFYWWTNLLVRSIKFFGREGSVTPGRLSPGTEDSALEMMWLWLKEYSLVAEAAVHPDYWYIRESENHHSQGFTASWCFCELLLRSPGYRDRVLDDGQNVATHFAAWTAFIKYYCAEKAKRGLFVEAASSYNALLLKGFYDLYDFAADPELRRSAQMLLDLFWASWAQEQLDGVRGGGRARTYSRWSVSGEDVYKRLAWLYLNMGAPAIPAQPEELGPLTSSYRLPAVVMDLALARTGRGVYEIRQWPLGLAESGFYTPKPGYRLKLDAGGILRYSYCTPDFILGTMMFEARPWQEWTMISSQNRWQGVIFAGNQDARIYPVPQPLSNEREYNSWWSVQSRGTLITRRLAEPYSSATGPMQVWFSRPGLTQRVERDGWIFVAAPSAFAAVRVVHGGFRWEEEHGPGNGIGDWLMCNDPDTAVVLEVARRSSFADYAAKLTYTSIYGDLLNFDCLGHQPPGINGHLLDYNPTMSLESPFLSAKWNSGMAEIRRGATRLELNFNPSRISSPQRPG
jgi:hypothetical protein